jgi:hypothetical protein
MKLALKRQSQPRLLNLGHREKASAAPESAFKRVVAEAIAVTEELNALTSSDGYRVTAQTLVREIVALVGSSLDQIAALRTALESDSPNFNEARTTLRRMMRELRDSKRAWISVPRDPTRLKFLSNEATNSELARNQLSYAELFCVAAQVIGEMNPECFGSCDDPKDWEKRVNALKKRQGELFATVASSLSAEELHIGPLDRNGMAMVSFKLSDGNVPIAPQDNSGERLVNYLIAKTRNRT